MTFQHVDPSDQSVNDNCLNQPNTLDCGQISRFVTSASANQNDVEIIQAVSTYRHRDNYNHDVLAYCLCCHKPDELSFCLSMYVCSVDWITNFVL